MKSHAFEQKQSLPNHQKYSFYKCDRGLIVSRKRSLRCFSSWCKFLCLNYHCFDCLCKHNFWYASKVMPFTVYFHSMMNVSIFMHAIFVYPSSQKSVLGLYFASSFLGDHLQLFVCP
jgi:hypothetical protein